MEIEMLAAFPFTWYLATLYYMLLFIKICNNKLLIHYTYSAVYFIWINVYTMEISTKMML